AGQQDLRQVDWLQTTIIHEMGIPLMLYAPFEQFGTKLTQARTNLLQQRVAIGKALQSGSIAAALEDAHLKDSFIPDTTNGTNPFPPDAPPAAPPVEHP
ncbi:MAG TPA: hypothetical protein VFN35_15275, partial [Ktedonobacteraceae bacterium]|nr:hypothetical protein [Ktedonobacteraceae bacterium]